MSEPYRILSFDGGGLRGVFTARVLVRLVGEFGIPDLIAKTDLIAGTSTGSILAVGLAIGKTPAELVTMYKEIGPSIFTHNVVTDATHLWGLTHAKYTTDARRRALLEQFGEVKLGDLNKRVLIATFDLGAGTGPGNPGGVKMWKAKFYHNVPGPDADMSDYAVDVVMKSSAAPVFFPIYQNHVDGGVVANNPAMCALAQALDPRNNEKHAIADMRMLSIGTCYSAESISSTDGEWGLLNWGVKLVDMFADGAVDLPHFQCTQLMGDDCYQRINRKLTMSVGMDDPGKLDALIHEADQVDLRPVADWLKQRWLTAADTHSS